MAQMLQTAYPYAVFFKENVFCSNWYESNSQYVGIGLGDDPCMCYNVSMS